MPTFYFLFCFYCFPCLVLLLSHFRPPSSRSRSCRCLCSFTFESSFFSFHFLFSICNPIFYSVLFFCFLQLVLLLIYFPLPSSCRPLSRWCLSFLTLQSSPSFFHIPCGFFFFKSFVRGVNSLCIVRQMRSCSAQTFSMKYNISPSPLPLVPSSKLCRREKRVPGNKTLPCFPVYSYELKPCVSL